MLRQRKQQPLDNQPSASPKTPVQVPADVDAMTWVSQNRWVVLAIASGGCAAFNGVFAKLTTTELTSTISKALSSALGLESIEEAFEYALRAGFFACNLIFNGIMWTLFTKALAQGNSTTQVSIINTGSNFVVTALLGFIIFSENLPPLWWLGAALLVAGNVIVGRKDETASSSDPAAADYDAVPQQAFDNGDLEDGDPRKRYHDEDIIDLGNISADDSASQGRRSGL
ncbi:hypothetical protein F5X68DRAFT_42017 [Plectosphaerella plurivora]|uniref:Transmembrane protein 42 n=1 Tax=Plectosphaerella plurivora TaxID=936078 RepID=A0A9P8V3Q4_9PEZI|nr:hypothetical protein F5X68DRAFT_42017 [Plectosphaerella plurivora]